MATTSVTPPAFTGESNLRAIALALLLSLLPTGVAVAQTTLETYYPAGEAQKGIGWEYRGDLAAAVDATQRKDLDAARARLAPIIAYCDAQQRPGRRIVSVSTRRQYETYLSAQADPEPTEWIDMTCPSAYEAAAFIHSGARQWDEALRLLDKAIALAPYSADPYTERGYVLNQRGQLKEGIDAYRRAIDLAEKFEGNANVKGPALRGIGWALVESNDLAGARKAYEDSLVADPGNELARSELEFIADKEKSR